MDRESEQERAGLQSVSYRNKNNNDYVSVITNFNIIINFELRIKISSIINRATDKIQEGAEILKPGRETRTCSI